MSNPDIPEKPKSLDSPVTGTIIKWMSRANTWAFKATGGRVGAKWRLGTKHFGDVPEVGILTTIGRKSGQQRSPRCCSCAKATGWFWWPRRVGVPPTRCGT